MPMQRKRSREKCQRFHYSYLERYDILQDSQVLIAVVAILLLGLRHSRGISPSDLVVKVIILSMACLMFEDAMKLPLSSRPEEGSRYLRISDFASPRHERYFYRRFRCRRIHLIEFMNCINLVDGETGAYKRIGLDCHRHYVHADSAKLVLLGRVSAATSPLIIIEEFGMDEQRLSQTCNIMSSYIYRVAEPYSTTLRAESASLYAGGVRAPV